MLVPVRCFTCGSLIADKFSQYQNEVQDGADPGKTLDSLDIRRYCCRRMLLTSVETIHQVVPFYEAMNKRNEEIRRDMA